MKHYLLTRWNLGIYSPENPYRDKVGNIAEWTGHRIALFEKYCLPSIIVQTCKEFVWLMAFDRNTPDWLLERYALIEQVRLIFEQPHEWLRKQPPTDEWLLTTRLDNDDMYRTDTIQRLHDAFDEREEVIDIGYDVLDLATWRSYPSGRTRNNSPFLSLSEPWTAHPMTAMGRPHTVMVDQYPNRRLDGTLATQIIHERNIINKTPKS